MVKVAKGESIVDLFVERASDETGHKVFHTLNLAGETRKSLDLMGEAFLKRARYVDHRASFVANLVMEEKLSIAEAKQVAKDVVENMKTLAPAFKKDM